MKLRFAFGFIMLYIVGILLAPVERTYSPDVDMVVREPIDRGTFLF